VRTSSSVVRSSARWSVRVGGLTAQCVYALSPSVVGGAMRRRRRCPRRARYGYEGRKSRNPSGRGRPDEGRSSAKFENNEHLPSASYVWFCRSTARNLTNCSVFRSDTVLERVVIVPTYDWRTSNSDFFSEVSVGVFFAFMFCRKRIRGLQVQLRTNEFAKGVPATSESCAPRPLMMRNEDGRKARGR